MNRLASILAAIALALVPACVTDASHDGNASEEAAAGGKGDGASSKLIALTAAESTELPAKWAYCLHAETFDHPVFWSRIKLICGAGGSDAAPYTLFVAAVTPDETQAVDKMFLVPHEFSTRPTAPTFRFGTNTVTMSFQAKRPVFDTSGGITSYVTKYLDVTLAFSGTETAPVVDATYTIR